MQNSSSNMSSYEAFINNINQQFIFNYLIVSSAIGIPGNLLSLIVFVRLMIRNPKINMGFLNMCQTIFDLSWLILSLIVIRGSIYLFGVNILTINDSYCRAFTFLRRFMIHAISWMLVLISFDRFLFVLYNNRFKFMKNKLILSAIIFVMLAFVAFENMTNLFYHIEGSSTCTGSYTVTIVSDIMSICFRLYIPVALMLVFNGLVIHRLVKSSRNSNLVRRNSIRSKEHKFTIAVMSYNLMFFLTNLPITVFYIIYDIDLYSGAFKNDSTFAALYSLYYNILFSLATVSSSISVFMYFAFNKLFQKEFPKLFLGCFSFGCLNEKTDSSVKSVSRLNDQ